MCNILKKTKDDDDTSATYTIDEHRWCHITLYCCINFRCVIRDWAPELFVNIHICKNICRKYISYINIAYTYENSTAANLIESASGVQAQRCVYSFLWPVYRKSFSAILNRTFSVCYIFYLLDDHDIWKRSMWFLSERLISIFALQSRFLSWTCRLWK